MPAAGSPSTRRPALSPSQTAPRSISRPRLDIPTALPCKGSPARVRAPTLALTDDAGGRFTINATTGIVTVANGAAIDFETAPGAGHSYGITVQSTAGALSTTQNFSIGVGDAQEA